MGWTIAPLLPVWLIAILAVAGIAACLVQFRTVTGRLGPGRGLFLSCLRLGALMLAILFVLNPSVTGETTHRLIPTVAVLVDTSLAMGLPGASGGGTRLDDARALLTGGSPGLLSSLGPSYDVRLYALGPELREIGVKDLAGLKADSRAGDLQDALKALSGRASCVVLVSDGTLIGGDRAANSLSGAPPVLSVAVGGRDGYKDVMISSVRFPQVAYRGRETTVEATIRSYGYKDATVPVVLKEGNRILAAKTVRLGRDASEANLSFPFAATEVGPHRLSVSVQPQVGEGITENNTADLSLKVARDKIRLLMVSGSPSPGYRLMRLALKNDPTVDLLSFVILRTPSNVINVPLNEQSLIPFPVDTLFGKELKDFDIVAFDNLPLHFYINEKHLTAVREFVQGGGALAMIGGPSLSDDGRLASGPLSSVLPVTFEAPDYRRGANASLRLTAAGLAHPLTRLFADREYNGRLWKEMAPLDGINLVKPVGAATVLLETGGVPSHPVLAVGGYGKGRVLVLGTDYSWKWAAGAVAKGGDNAAYLRFIERMVRWLARDPGLDRMTIRLPELPGITGESIEVKIGTDEGEGGRAEPPLFSVFGPDGSKITSEVKPGASGGEFIGSFVPPRRGAYRLTVKSTTGAIEETVTIGTAMDTLDGAPKPEILKAVSAATGGRALSGGEGLEGAISAYAGQDRKSFTERKEAPLRRNYYALAVLTVLLCGEWYLRRRWGLA